MEDWLHIRKNKSEETESQQRRKKTEESKERKDEEKKVGAGKKVEREGVIDKQKVKKVAKIFGVTVKERKKQERKYLYRKKLKWRKKR